MHDQGKKNSIQKPFQLNFVSQLPKQQVKIQPEIIEMNQRPKPQEGKWKIEEQLAYLNYIQENQSLFNTPSATKNDMLFQHLSQRLQYKRTPEQCKSHFYKMLKNISYSPVAQDMIAYLNQRLKKKEKYRKKLQRYAKQKQESKKLMEQDGYEIWMKEGAQTTITIRLQMGKIRKWE